ncbi:hypothetical protein D1AOALGA4SA_10173 [Olavius algarvensis Delta 1 endosymbiont]|nr:hypothetical protein D1AOALGA4SA_10173 [Olavius algarvensis Delta 1 endosymbiont]
MIRFSIFDFGFKEFYLILKMDRAKRYHRSKIRNLKSKINSVFIQLIVKLLLNH